MCNIFRYIYLWIMYALFEETEMGDMERTREVWKACLEIIPHKHLTFSKIWIYFAQFEIRQKNLSAARKILGMGIGRAPKDKLFRNGEISVVLQGINNFELEKNIVDIRNKRAIKVS